MQATFLDAPTAIEPRGGRASVRPEVEPLPDHFFTASGILRYANVTSDKILTRAYTNREKLALALLRMNDPYGRGAFVTDAEFALACGIETGGKDKGRGQVARVIRGLVAKGAIGIVPVSPHVHISGRMFHLPPDPTRAEPFPRAFLPSEVEASPRDMSAKPPWRRRQGPSY